MTTWVGRYAIVDGEVREHGPWLVDRQRRHEDSMLRLLVLAEPVDRRSAEFCNEVAEAVAALFTRDSLSITGGLQRALQQTHANLAEWNRRSLREHRVAVGVTAVVVRGDQATVAQVGAGPVFMREGDEVNRLGTEELPAAAPLGTETAIEPRFTATSLEDRELLLLTSAAERALPDGAIERALLAGPERALASLFLETRDVRDMTAVLVANLDVPEEALEDDLIGPPELPPEEVEGREVASLLDGGLHDTAPVGGGTDRHADDATVDEESRDRTPIDIDSGLPERVIGSTEEPGAGTSERGRDPIPLRPSAPQSVSSASAAGTGAGMSAAGTSAPESGGRRQRLRRRVGRAGGPPLPRLRRAPGVRSGGGLRGGLLGGMPARSALWGGAIVIALVTLLLAAWLVIPRLLDEDRAAQLEDSIAAAQAQMQVAENAPEPGAQRQALETVFVELERARSLAASDPRIANLEALAQARLATLDAVMPVPELTPLLVFEGAVTAPVSAERIVSGGGAVWLLESERGRVIRVHSAAGEASEVYRAGETYAGETAGTPQALAWDASTGQLLVLDDAAVLYAIPDGPIPAPRLVPLRDAGDLTAVVDMVVYSGNLYLLDGGGTGEVWRYLPAGDGFDSERTGILGNVELTTPLALAVDGDVYVQDGGTLRRFSQGRELEPMLEGIDAPPETAVAMVEDAPRGLIYVADRGGSRVVVSDATGAFLRQYRHPDFADLRGLAVSPDGARIFVLTGDRIASFAANGNGAGNGSGSGASGGGAAAGSDSPATPGAGTPDPETNVDDEDGAEEESGIVISPGDGTAGESDASEGTGTGDSNLGGDLGSDLGGDDELEESTGADE